MVLLLLLLLLIVVLLQVASRSGSSNSRTTIEIIAAVTGLVVMDERWPGAGDDNDEDRNELDVRCDRAIRKGITISSLSLPRRRHHHHHNTLEKMVKDQ